MCPHVKTNSAISQLHLIQTLQSEWYRNQKNGCPSRERLFCDSCGKQSVPQPVSDWRRAPHGHTKKISLPTTHTRLHTTADEHEREERERSGGEERMTTRELRERWRTEGAVRIVGEKEREKTKNRE